MANFSIRLDLQKVPGAFLTKIKGKNETKECLCIPIEDAKLFVGTKGTYLDLAAIEVKEPKYEQTHLIKRSLPKDVYDAMSEEERKEQPIVGNMHELKATTQKITETAEAEDDLPF